MLVNRPIAVTMALLSIVVLGLVSFSLLPVSLIPDIDIPFISVQVTDSRLSAKQMEDAVVKPITQQLMQIDELEDISSLSKDGSASIQLSFGHSSNIDLLFLEVHERLDRVLPSLPENIQRPRVIKASAADIPVFYIDISYSDESNGNFVALGNFATKVLNRKIEQLEQVAMSDISGYDSPQISIIPNKEKLLSLGISLNEFENYIRSANIRLGTLTIRDGEYSYNVKFESLLTGIDGIKEIAIKKGDKLFKLKDLAQVQRESVKRRGYIHSNGKQALSIAVIKQSDAKMSDLKKSLGQLIKEFKTDYPQIKFEITRNQSQLLDYSIRNLLINILLAVLLSGVIIFLFLRDIKSSFLVITVIPLSLISSMLLFYLTGLSINILSLSGLILGLGMMVDNAIILIDNISERWKRTADLYSSVIEGTKEVRGAMFSSLLTTCAVFIPVVFLSGTAGSLFTEQAIAVTITLVTSYLMTVCIMPVYYYWWYKKESLHSIFIKKFDLVSPLLKWESRVIEKSLKKSRVFVAAIVISAIGAIVLFAFLKKERLPHISYSESIICIDWNNQISVESNRLRVSEIEQLIKSDNTQITSYIGVQQYLLRHTSELSTSQANIYVKCKNERELNKIKERILVYITASYPDAVCSFKESGNILNMTFGNEQSPLVAKLRFSSNSSVDLGKLLNSIEKINEIAPATADIKTEKNLLYVANPTAMALYGVSYKDLLYTLKNLLNENVLFEIVQGKQVLPVVLGEGEKKLTELISGSFVVKDDVRLPLSSFLRETYVQDFQYITSDAEGIFYPVNINLSGREAKSVMKKIEETLKEESLFDVSFSGSWFINRELRYELILAFIVALILLYIILAAQFNSLVQPLIILSEIVIDVFAVLVFMLIFRVSVNIMSLIGLVIVSGIVINDSILKIDTINKLRDSGMEVYQALKEAGFRRTKSIVMTSLTTILAVLPFVKRGSLGDDLQFPLSIVIIFGMMVGTLVSLFVVPSLYHYLYNKNKGE